MIQLVFGEHFFETFIHRVDSCSLDGQLHVLIEPFKFTPFIGYLGLIVGGR